MEKSDTTQTRKTFSELIDGDKPVLVDFYAEWCGPCKLMKPILEELKSRVHDSATIIKIDVDRNLRVASNYNIRSVPTLMVFKKGEILWSQPGVVQADVLEKVLTNHKA